MNNDAICLLAIGAFIGAVVIVVIFAIIEAVQTPVASETELQLRLIDIRLSKMSVKLSKIENKLEERPADNKSPKKKAKGFIIRNYRHSSGIVRDKVIDFIEQGEGIPPVPRDSELPSGLKKHWH